jgi:hypothetical protein
VADGWRLEKGARLRAFQALVQLSVNKMKLEPFLDLEAFRESVFSCVLGVSVI